jgi:uncharacterized protein YcaQ
MTPLTLDPLTARRFMRRALLLDEPAPDVGAALGHHGYIQIDPINVTGRMHDLILRNRVHAYREGDLMRHLHGIQRPLPASRRKAFEHHLPSAGTLVAFTLDAWPHLLASMRSRQHRTSAWSGRLSPRQKELVPTLLAEIAARGPLCSEDFADTGKARSFWGASTQAKATLQKLFFHGRLLIARRSEGNRRYYDLPERVLPAAWLRKPASTKKESARWEALLKLRQRRLVLLKRSELSLVGDLVQPVKIEGLPLLHCLRSDVALFEGGTRPSAAAEPMADRQDGSIDASILKTRPEAAFHPILLAPLDPLIYDRRLTSALWGFDYTWEVYVPPAKRKRGYYALPVLAGTDLVGHVDPKAERERKKLRIVSRVVRRGHRVADAVRTLAGWLGLK